MKLLFLLMLCASYSTAEIYLYSVKYTATAGIAGLPEFTASSFLHGKQIDYYDSKERALLPRQQWAKRILGESYWEKTTRLRFSESVQLQQELSSVMEVYGHAEGPHTFQRMYGCLWDDSTGYSDGFDVYGYDGQNFLSLDMKSRRFTALVTQAKTIAQNWNRNTTRLEILHLYYTYECVAWLKTYFFKDDRHDPWTYTGYSEINAIVLPTMFQHLKRSLPQAVLCRVSGLSSSSVLMSWQRNEKDFNMDDFVVIGDTLPSGDGTFQKTIYLFVGFEELMQNKYKCVLDFRSLAGKSIMTMSQDTELRFSNESQSHPHDSHSKGGSYDDDEYDDEAYVEDDYYEEAEEEDDDDDDDDVWIRPEFYRKKF